MSFRSHYKPPDNNKWLGRVDPDENSLRLHQVVQLLNLKDLKVDQGSNQQFYTPANTDKIAIIGFRCDEGVRRNQGRRGASQGADAIRTSLANLSVHFNEKETRVFDAGDIFYHDIAPSHDSLLSTQLALSTAIQILLFNGFFPIVLGGGHEMAFGHYHGLHFFFQHNTKVKSKEDLGIINFDAHFDLRTMDNEQGTSGTPFYQIAKLVKKRPFPYLCLGIQKGSNTKNLFNTVEELGAQYIFADKINLRQRATLTEIETFIQDKKYLYLTICMDVFDSAFAPGVSAPASNGLLPLNFFPILRAIINSNKLVGVDIAEMSPAHDIDQHTAKLASLILFNLLPS